MKILVLTSVYPGPDIPKGFTPVVHYFTKEWVKMGYDVRVIHCCTYFPRFYYNAPSWFRKIVQNKFGIALPQKQLSNETEYELEGVKVYRLPMKKWMPMGNYADNVLITACKKAEAFLEREGFKPEHIISHWLNPQLFLMSYLKHHTDAVTTLVLHELIESVAKKFRNSANMIADVDIWGYRALNMKENFEHIYGQPRFSFRCFSGIPEFYTHNVPKRDGTFHNSFVQVGLLMDRKFPDKTIDAVSSIYGNDEYSLKIIGEGAMRKTLEIKIEELNASDKICLTGRLPRQDIIPILDQSDVFVMISKAEVFGLVYIEAMARGCIVIASRGEGMEGVIENGKNGYLCEAGNSTELANIIRSIKGLSNEERKKISDAAIATSLKITDVSVAKDYIDTVVEYGKEMANTEWKEIYNYHAMLLSNMKAGGADC